MDIILNLVWIVIYITILVVTIFALFYTIRVLYNVYVSPPVYYVLGDVVKYTLTTSQPVMVLPNYVYMGINMPPAHNVYLLWLCGVTAILSFMTVFWLLGIIIQKVFLMPENPFTFIDFPLPWATLYKMGFFTWLLEKTMLDKNEDVIMFVLNIFRTALKPDEFKAAQKRCLENYVSAPATKANPFADIKMFQLPQPHKEYIDYNLKNELAKDRLDDTFYTESYKSIKHREAANTYRKMTILRPDTVNDVRMPDMDVEDTINIGMSYRYI